MQSQSQNHTVSEEQAADMFRSGRFVVMGEYRSSEAETITWRDRQSGRSMSAPVVRHVVEFGPKSVIVQERVPENLNVQEYHSPLNRGQRVLVEVTAMEQNRGSISVRGSITPVTG